MCLNHIISRLPLSTKRVAITSIGIDGEGLDQVTGTAKPEITVRAGMYFATSEKHYRSRHLLSELVDVSDETTSLGRVVTAKALIDGQVMLSGPSSGLSLKRWMRGIAGIGAHLVIVDGALSRLSSASPAITESMILATGAAYSSSLKTLVQKTAFVVELINIEMLDDASLIEMLDGIESGLWGIDEAGMLVNLNATTSLNLNTLHKDALKACRVVFVAGALTDRFLTAIRQSGCVADIVLVVRDFTKIFVPQQSYSMFVKMGGTIRVLHRSKLIAVTVNPTAPSGIVLNSQELCAQLTERLHLPVYDLVKLKIENG